MKKMLSKQLKEKLKEAEKKYKKQMKKQKVKDQEERKKQEEKHSALILQLAKSQEQNPLHKPPGTQTNQATQQAGTLTPSPEQTELQRDFQVFLAKKKAKEANKALRKAQIRKEQAAAFKAFQAQRATNSARQHDHTQHDIDVELDFGDDSDSESDDDSLYELEPDPTQTTLT